MVSPKSVKKKRFRRTSKIPTKITRKITIPQSGARKGKFNFIKFLIFEKIVGILRREMFA